MKYFLDTEFIEGFHKPLFGKRRHFIDLISIGIVAEDGREYYAISNEWRYNDADQWVKENVIHQLPLKLGNKEAISDFYKRCKVPQSYQGKWHEVKSNSTIAKEIAEFCNCSVLFSEKGQMSATSNDKFYSGTDTEFYAYYADYDWVVFCSLFGRMIDLPKGFPMYCKDLKQILDQKAEDMNEITLETVVYKSEDFSQPGERMATTKMQTDTWSAKDKLEIIKTQKGYPQQENEHSAIDDAKWNKKLYEFLQTV